MKKQTITIPYEEIVEKGEKEKKVVSLIDADILEEIENGAKLFTGSSGVRDKKRLFCLSLAAGNSAFIAARHTGKDWHNLLYGERKKDEVFAELWKRAEFAFNETVKDIVEKVELEKANEHDARASTLWDMWLNNMENKELLGEARKFFEAASKIRVSIAQLILKRKQAEQPIIPNTVVINQQQNFTQEVIQNATDEQLEAIIKIFAKVNANQITVK